MSRNRSYEVLQDLAFAQVEDLVLVCTGREPFADASLERLLQRLRRRDYRAMLFSCPTVMPTATQRARIAAFWKSVPFPMPRSATLTDSRVIQMIATALWWLVNTGDHVLLSSSELAKALAFLQTSALDAEVRATIKDLHAALEKSLMADARRY